MKDATDEYGDLETKYKTERLKHEEEMTQRNECILLLRKELQDANELLKVTKEGTIDFFRSGRC